MLLDRELRYVAANPAYLRITGTRLGDLLGRNVFEVFPEGQSENDLRASFRRVLTSRQTDVIPLIPYRVPIRLPDGRVVDEERFWSASHVPLLDAAGEVEFILQHTVDVTEVHRLRSGGASSGSPPLELAQGVLGRAEAVQLANLALEKEQEQWRRLFAQAPGFVAYLRGPRHEFVFTNHAYDQLIGHRRVVGKPLAEALPEVIPQGFVDLLDKVRASGQPFVGRSTPVLLQRSAGAPVEERIVDFVYQPILDGDGAPLGVLVQGNDLTEQKRVEAERERLATIVEQSSDFIGVASPDGRPLYVNEAGKALVGLSGRDIGATRIVDYFFPEDLPFVEGTILATALRTGRWEGETRFRHFQTGEAIPVLYHVFVIKRPGSDQPEALATITREISAQKRQLREREQLLEREREARARAESAERQYRFLAEAIPQHVWTALPDGRLEFVNSRVTEDFGVPLEQILGEGWRPFVHPEDLARVAERWLRSVGTGERYEVTSRLRTRDGAYRWFISRGQALLGDDGKPLRWYGTNTDIDEAKRARDELEERTEYEQQLIGIVSHDLRNPLTAIGVTASVIMRQGHLDDRQVASVARIMSLTQKAGRLIRDFLDFSQARSAGQIPIDPAPANLRELVRQMVDEVHVSRPERAVTVEHRGEETGRWDVDRLCQVIGNLVGNAFQHSPESATVRVRSEISGDTAKVVVHNDGPPISREDLPRLFQPFRRGTGAATTAGHSVGLGLYISHAIIAAHGGEISVRSEPGEGTRFTITLPREVTSRGTPRPPP